jgi:hypothetical protein
MQAKNVPSYVKKKVSRKWGKLEILCWLNEQNSK